MSRKLVAATLAGVLAAACATRSYELMPQMSNGQDLTAVAGLSRTTILESRMPGGVVSVRAADEFTSYGASFLVAVQNTGAGPLEFGAGNLSASAAAKPLRVYSAEELDVTIKNSAREVLRARERVDDPSNPRRGIEQASVDVSRQNSFNNFSGCPLGQARCLVDSPDQGRSYRLDQANRLQNLETSVEVATQLQKELPAVQQKALRTASIGPGQIGGGIIVVQHPKPGETIDLVVEVAGQRHTFSYAAKPGA